MNDVSVACVGCKRSFVCVPSLFANRNGPGFAACCTELDNPKAVYVVGKWQPDGYSIKCFACERPDAAFVDLVASAFRAVAPPAIYWFAVGRTTRFAL